MDTTVTWIATDRREIFSQEEVKRAQIKAEWLWLKGGQRGDSPVIDRISDHEIRLHLPITVCERQVLKALRGNRHRDIQFQER